MERVDMERVDMESDAIELQKDLFCAFNCKTENRPFIQNITKAICSQIS